MTLAAINRDLCSPVPLGTVPADAFKTRCAAATGKLVRLILRRGHGPQVMPLVVQAVMVDVVGLRPASDQLLHPGRGTAPARLADVGQRICHAAWTLLEGEPPAGDDELVVLVIDEGDAACGHFP